MFSFEGVTDWFLPVGLALVLLCIPGAVVLRALRLPWWFVVPVGPAVTCLMLLLTSTALHLTGIPWTPLATVVVLLLMMVAAWAWPLLRRMRSTYTQDCARHVAHSRPAGTATSVAIGGTVGSIAVVLPATLTIGAADTPNISYDAFFHHSAVAFVRELGDAFPLTALAPLYGGAEHYYPTTWHMVASLVPADVVVSSNAVVVATLALLGPGVAALIALLLPIDVDPWLRHAAIIGAAATSGLFLSLPALALAKGFWPFALASALLPAGIAGLWLVMLPGALRVSGVCASRTGGALVVAGVASVHPTVGVSLAVAAAAIVAAMLLSRALEPRTRKSGVVGLVLMVAAVGVAVPVVSLLGQRMASLTPLEDHNSPLVHAVRLLSDTPRVSGLPTSPFEIAPILALAAAGAVFVLRRRSMQGIAFLIVTAVAALLAVFTQSTSDLLNGLTGPWYGGRERLGPLYSVGMLILAGHGVLAVAQGGADLLLKGRPRLVAGALTVLLVLVSIIAAANPQRVRLLASTEYLGGEKVGLTYLTPKEYEFIERTAEDLGPDAVVLGIPYDGTPAYWFASGVTVVLPSMTTPKTVDSGRVSTYGWDIGPGNRACESAKNLGITHIYEDHGPMSADVINPSEVDRLYEGVRSFPEEYLTVVAESDGHVLYEVDLPC